MVKILSKWRIGHDDAVVYDSVGRFGEKERSLT
jgi:hypothetical protein